MSAIDGGTVLVTGASSGIGMEIARAVAPRANCVVLVARRLARLDELKEELTKSHPSLRVETIACDLSDRDAAKKLPAEVTARGLAVDVLVNNAGVGMMGAFDRADPDKLLAMIDLNVTSLTILTRALLPAMVEKGRGGVINVSSGFGVAVMPSFAAYVATKHYVTGLSEALVSDLAGTGVVVTQVLPGPVATEFEQQIGNYTGRRAPGIVEISAARCARATIRGFDRGRAMVVPGVLISLALLVNALSPRFMRRLFASILGRVARRKEAEATAG
ncbi:MAG: SDR family oxidoreductase [Labilithrix sp.]|nr:SDR family oxidoreductase [Labilithrix sp.]MCW5811409.1 SDR family oxidoreductase [Labilithrix sp.]